MPARPAVAGFVFGERRGGRAAVVRGAAAARGERAASRQRGKVGRPAADHRQRRVRRPLQPRDGLEQGLGVRHPDVREQLRRRRLLHDLTRVHHDDLVGAGAGQAEIVADQHQRHAEFGPQLEQQFHDLRLGGHVQRGGRLVGDEQLRAAGQRDGDHDALPHAAGELVRVLVKAPAGHRNVHQAQQFDGLLAGFGLGDLPVRRGRLRRSGSRPSSWGSATGTGPGTPSRCSCRGACASRRRSARAARRGSNLAEPVTTAACGSSPMSARQLTVLPDPDSPTMASVCWE